MRNPLDFSCHSRYMKNNASPRVVPWVVQTFLKRDIMGTAIEYSPEDLRARLDVVTWAGLLARLGGLGKLPMRRPAPAATVERLW